MPQVRSCLLPPQRYARRAALVGIVAVAAGWGVMPVSASDLAPQVYRLAGTEIRATSSSGTFTGEGLRSPGNALVWKATVRHTALNRNPATPAQITGGTVALRLWSKRSLSVISGDVTEGTVTFNKMRSSTAACAKEVYDVSGILGNVRSGGLVGHGAIQVALTHHRRMIWGHCITYGATLSGNLSLSF
jgi:hypothetical protein